MKFRGYVLANIVFMGLICVLLLAGRTRTGFLMSSAIFALCFVLCIVFYRRGVLGQIGETLFTAIAVMSGLGALALLGASLTALH